MMSDNKSCRVIDKNSTKLVQLYLALHYREKQKLFVQLLDGDFDINYRIPTDNINFQVNWMDNESCSTLFQLVYTDVDKCQILLDHGADFTVTDKKGSTVLLVETTSYEYKSYLDIMSMGHHHETCYADLILSAHIKSGNAKNPRDRNGVSHFHVACMYNRVDAAKFFLENGVPVDETVNRDSNFYPGFSALHFAAKSCVIETVELLLTSGADMFAQDSKGMNPLHILIVERRKTLIKLQRHLRMPPSNRESKYCSELQEYCDTNLKIIYLLLENMKELDRTVDNIGLSYLHVLCFLGNTTTIQEFLDNNNESLKQSVCMDSPVWPCYTALHFAAHCNMETVELLLKKGADLSAKDAKGVSPFELCLKEFSIADIHKVLLLQSDYFNITFSNNKTRLGDFIHAMQELPTLEIFLKNNLCRLHPNRFIPVDSPVCAGFTALHLVVVCAEELTNWSSTNHDYNYVLLDDMASEKSQNYLSRIASCLRYNPDITSADARCSTPLHWAFKLQQSQAVHILLERHVSNANPVAEDGLSHLHIACAAKNVIVIEKLLSGGANINEVAASSYNWMDIDESGWLGQQVQKYTINKGSTPLHFASSVCGHEAVQILIDHNADVLAKDAEGLNPLEKLYGVPIFRDLDCDEQPNLSSFGGSEKETIKLLVKSIGNQLVDTKPKQMMYCYSLMGEDRLFKMIHDDPSVTKVFESFGITALHVACLTQNLDRVNELIGEIDVNARVVSESPLWAGCTPLNLFTMHFGPRTPLNNSTTSRAILDKLLQSGADLLAKNDEGDTPIHQIFKYHWFLFGETVKQIKDFSVNPKGKAGYTHLHIASCCDAAAPIVEELLKHGAVVDETANYFDEEFPGFTALQFATFFQRKDVVDVLLKFGADANWKNAYGGNALHVANKEDRPGPCLELLQTLISAGADINLKDMYGETPLVKLLKSENRSKEEIELFLTPQMRFHTFNLISDEGFLAVALNRRAEMPIYDMAVNAADVKDIDVNGRNAIHNIVSFKRPSWGDLDNIMIDEDAISDKYTPTEVYIREISSLLKLGLNIDQQDCKGSTPLHFATRMQNLTGIVGLLENGVDINITDADGKPAFAYSFELAKIHQQTNYYTRRKELRELDARILKVILTHLYKLNLAGIAINQSTREVCAEMREIQSYDATRIEKCVNEIEEMKDQKIGSTSITFYEFLSDTGAVSNFPYFLSRQQTAIGCLFENEVEVVRQIFPELSGILLLQYRKALARCNIIESAVSSLTLLVNFSIPPNISKIILRFLNNNELDKLISSTTPRD